MSIPGFSILDSGTPVTLVRTYQGRFFRGLLAGPDYVEVVDEDGAVRQIEIAESDRVEVVVPDGAR